MSFAARETSRTLGEPVELYLFWYGSTDTAYYAYTDGETPITKSEQAPSGATISVTYSPVPIARGSINVSGSLDKSKLEIRGPRDLAVGGQFLVYPPTQPVSVTVYSGHVGETDWLVTWSGTALSCAFELSEIKLTCEPISAALRRNMLRRMYQYTCPHVLYGPRCKADQAAATVSGTVTAIAGQSISLTAGWNAQAVDKYLGGLVSWTGPSGTERRTIIGVSGNTLRLSGLLRNLAVGNSVSVALGCNRKMDGCALQNNIYNFGGFPFIPPKNPLGNTSNFY